MSDLQRINLTITGIEKKVASNGSVFYNIKDENNRNLKLWQNIKDGSESAAYKALKELPNEGIGQRIVAAIESQPGEFQGKQITYRSIKAIIGLAENTNSTMPQGTTPQFDTTPKGVDLSEIKQQLSEIQALLTILVDKASVQEIPEDESVVVGDDEVDFNNSIE